MNDFRKSSRRRKQSTVPPGRSDQLGNHHIAAWISEHGLFEPLIITADGYIVSGHRHYAAAGLAKLNSVPVRRLRIKRTSGSFVLAIVAGT